jgi:hypothetical protein
LRDRGAALNLAPLRRIAFDLARVDGSLKASPEGEHKHAGRDDAFVPR